MPILRGRQDTYFSFLNYTQSIEDRRLTFKGLRRTCKSRTQSIIQEGRRRIVAFYLPRKRQLNHLDRCDTMSHINRFNIFDGIDIRHRIGFSKDMLSR